MSWFENKDFWCFFYDWMFPKESFQQAREQVGDIMSLGEIEQGSVLDLCCGPGRHSIPFAQAGFAVTAVDLQPMLLDKAQEYSAREHVSVEYIQENMLTFKRADSFDLVISMFSSFGYFSDPEDDYRVLQNAYQSLKPGGKLLMDVRGKEIHAMANVTSFSQQMPNGDFIFHRTEVADGWSRSNSDWVYVSGEQAHSFKMNFNLYSAVELKALLQKAGFSTVAVYGDLKGAAYNHHATRLILLAEKN